MGAEYAMDNNTRNSLERIKIKPNKHMYIFRAYKIQSFVLIISIIIFYFYLSIIEGPEEFGYKRFGDPLFVSIVCFLWYEFILIPVNTLYLCIIKKIKCNHIKIYSNKSIAVFALCFELVFLFNGYISNYINNNFGILFVDYLIISLGIILLNILLVFLNKEERER
jgi:hypothetical protein